MTAPSDQTPAEEAPNGLSRRSVVRVGAAAAWSVPVVALATSAPALAASGDALDITALAVAWGGFAGRRLTYTVTIKNTGPSPTSAPLVVTLILPKGTNRLANSLTRWSQDGGWTPAGPDGSGPWTYTYTRGASLASGASITFTASLANLFGSSNSSTQVTTTATATSGTFASDTESQSLT